MGCVRARHATAARMAARLRALRVADVADWPWAVFVRDTQPGCSAWACPRTCGSETPNPEGVMEEKLGRVLRLRQDRPDEPSSAFVRIAAKKNERGRTLSVQPLPMLFLAIDRPAVRSRSSHAASRLRQAHRPLPAVSDRLPDLGVKSAYFRLRSRGRPRASRHSVAGSGTMAPPSIRQGPFGSLMSTPTPAESTSKTRPSMVPSAGSLALRVI